MRKQGFSLLTCSILEKQEALTIHKKKCQSLNNYNFILNLMTLFLKKPRPQFFIKIHISIQTVLPVRT